VCLTCQLQESARRYSVWSANVARINARTASNAASGASHKLGLTAHTDLTTDEFKARYLGAPMSPAERTSSPQHQHQHSTILQTAGSWLSALWWPGRQPARPLTKKDKPQHWRYENVTAPASVDWRTHTPTVLGAIKDQHVNGTPCGSCWAFSAVSIMEISSAMATGESNSSCLPASLLRIVSQLLWVCRSPG
jgi:cathepsin L